MIIRRFLLLVITSSLLAACVDTSTYRAYLGEVREPRQLSVITGAQFTRQDMINRHTDAVKFSAIDGIPIENSIGYRAIEVAPGFHDIEVYFYWDMGVQRGLATALVTYASSRETTSRKLRFNARPGITYTVKAQPYFREAREDITTLSHVDFWIEDQNGTEIVSREDGKFES